MEDETKTIEENQDDVIVEDEKGKISIRVDEGLESPGTASPEEQAAKEKTTESPIYEGEDETYKGKTVDEIIEMHKNASAKITEQGKTIGDTRRFLESEPISQEQIREKLTANDIKAAYLSEKAKLTEMDQYDNKSEFLEQSAVVDQLHADWEEKRDAEAVNQRLSSQHNQNFIKEFKSNLKEKGIEISDEEFEKTIEIAKSYRDNGRFTENSIFHALQDQFGIEKISKFFAIKGEQKARKDISKASKKQEIKVDISGGGKSSKLIRLDDMSPAEMEKTIENMSTSQRKLLQEKLEKTL